MNVTEPWEENVALICLSANLRTKDGENERGGVNKMMEKFCPMSSVLN